MDSASLWVRLAVIVRERRWDMSQESKKKPGMKRPVRGMEPNAESRAAIEELEFGQGKRVATVEELMAELNAEEEGAQVWQAEDH